MSFTLEEIKIYLLTCDSLGDAIYFLTEESIQNANAKDEESDSDDREWLRKQVKEAGGSITVCPRW